MLRKSELLFPSTSKQDSSSIIYDQFESDSSSFNDGQTCPTTRSFLHDWGERDVSIPSESSSSGGTRESQARTPVTANLVVKSAGTGSFTEVTDAEAGNVVVDEIPPVETVTTNQSNAEPSSEDHGNEREEEDIVDEHASIVEDKTPPDEPSKNVHRSQVRRFSILVLTSLSLLAAIVVVAVFVFQTENHHDESSAIASTAGPVGTPRSRQQDIDNILRSVSNTSDLDQLGSPQARARYWLLFDDHLQLDPMNVTQDRVIQRYALAVFYFATGGPTSWENNHWLRDGECGDTVWDGLNCNEKSQVRGLVLANLGLSGSIPSELFHLSLLENLVLKGNHRLEGTISTAIGNLRELVQLGLYNNSLTGSLPQTLFGASNLRYINLQDNHFTGTFFANVSHWEKLETLVLMSNQLQGKISWGELALAKLRFLGLSGNNFSGTIGASLSQVSNLRFLYLDSNSFMGSIPSEIGLLTSLESLNLDRNNLSGTIPKQIGNLTKLTYLSMQSNDLKGSLPSEIAQLTLLETLKLATNSLVGSIPDYSKLQHLINLQLQQNLLSGAIPETLFDMNQLEILFLSSNKLNGSIPANISNLERTLRGLYLSENTLNGSIPSDLCSMRVLEALFLDTNQITGSLPTCVGALRDLRQLFVFRNELSGGIPSGLANLTLLEGLGLENNGLVGSLPLDACKLHASLLSTIWADCGGTAPLVKCTCCTVCCPSSQCPATS